MYQYDHVDKNHHYGIYHQLELLTKNGETSLTEACYHGKLESVTVLLRAGAKTDIQDKVCIHNINFSCYNDCISLMSISMVVPDSYGLATRDM